MSNHIIFHKIRTQYPFFFSVGGFRCVFVRKGFLSSSFFRNRYPTLSNKACYRQCVISTKTAPLKTTWERNNVLHDLLRHCPSGYLVPRSRGFIFNLLDQTTYGPKYHISALYTCRTRPLDNAHHFYKLTKNRIHWIFLCKIIS